MLMGAERAVACVVKMGLGLLLLGFGTENHALVGLLVGTTVLEIGLDPSLRSLYDSEHPPLLWDNGRLPLELR
ncbi:hypothetical protein BC826DRAFT_1047262 [Russula brevipes]|nr:hypothetical protein BC826DRAFT_1047262 [Russula brevipes]